MPLVAQFHVARIHHLGDDVGSLAKVVVNEVRFAVLHFVHAELFRCVGLDVGELVIVIDGSNIKWRLVQAKRVIKLEGQGIRTLVFVHRLRDMRLYRGELLPRLLKLGGRHKLRRAGRGDDRRAVHWLNQNLEIGHSRAIRDILQREAVNVALISDQVQIGTDAGLGRVDKTEVAHNIDHPELLVAGCRLHDLL